MGCHGIAVGRHGIAIGRHGIAILCHRNFKAAHGIVMGCLGKNVGICFNFRGLPWRYHGPICRSAVK